MTTTINGKVYLEMIASGIRYLDLHRATVNDLNVFPVPDGDTGTNMVMTMRYGLDSVKERPDSLSAAARELSRNAVFGARGNSGVILSQFFRGIAESLNGVEQGSAEDISRAFVAGCSSAYSAVAKPVEGTMLTVLKDAARATECQEARQSLDSLLSVYLKAARISLANTPELLPILKKAHVVDSGGAGVVYLFEGMQKYLNGESVDAPDASDTIGRNAPEYSVQPDFDYSLINKNTRFDYGYCIESLIQLKIDAEDFDEDDFREKLEGRGNSIVLTLVGDKLKLHVHSKRPGKILDICQEIGELLTLKIENMTVQNIEKEMKAKPREKYLVAEEPSGTEFAVVAVAPNTTIQKLFSDMGADVVILSEIAPSSQEFMEAFDFVSDREILVFPNSSNSVLSAMQAASLYRKSFVSTVNCRSIPQCYSALAMMDFESTAKDAIRSSRSAIADIYEFSVYHAMKDTSFGKTDICKNDFFAISGKTLLGVEDTLERATLKAAESVVKEKSCTALTVFYSEGMAEEFVNAMVSKLEDIAGAEVVAVMAGEISASFTIMIE